MSTNNQRTTTDPSHGEIGYLQLPATDLVASARFYEAVFGWSVELTYGSFAAPNMIGQWTIERPVRTDSGPVLWIGASNLYKTLDAVQRNGGTLINQPELDQGERWLAEIDDPAGNRIGIFCRAERLRPQPLIAVNDVEASSRWYQHLLGLYSDHGGPHYERLLSDGTLVLQLHHREVEHDHGPVGNAGQPVGNGMLVWFGEVSDFDGVVARAEELHAPVTHPPRRNPPDPVDNGPSHRELWITDPDGYTVVIASPDGEAYQP